MTRRTVVLGAVLAVVALAIAALGALYWASRSETVLRWTIAQAARHLPGQLSIEGVRGSLTEPIAIAHVRYTHDALTVDARDLTLAWSSWELVVRKRVWIQELRARELVVRATAGKSAAEPKPPQDLGIPLRVQIDRLHVDKLTLHHDEATFSASDVRLAYTGDARSHRLDLQNIDTQWGRATAALQLAAQKPFSLNGRADFHGEPVAGWPTVAHVDLGGTLPAVDAGWQLRLHNLPISGTLRAAPFTSSVVESLTARANGIDLKDFVPDAPQTKLDLAFAGNGAVGPRLEGSLRMSNLLPGPIDAGRVPLTALQGHVTVTAGELKLSRASADLGPAGTAALDALIARDALTASLTTQRLDLRGIHSALRTTHLAGSAHASIGPRGREYRGELAQDALRLAFSARQEGDVLRVESIDLRAGAASVAASGTLGLSEPNPFSTRGELNRFDPSAFGDFPAAAINGTFEANGTLRPQWRVALAYQLDRSTFRGHALSGRGKLIASPRAVRDVDADVALGSNRLHLEGALGEVNDVMRFKLDAPAVQALGTQWSGSINAAGSVSGALARSGLDIDLTARGLATPGGYRAEALQLRARLKHDADAQFELTSHAQGLNVGGQTLASADVRGIGTLRQHRLEARLMRAGVDVSCNLEGGWNVTARSWSGRLTALENRGQFPFKLSAPTDLTVAREQITVSATQIELVGGRIDLGATRYARGELTSSGSLTGLSSAKVLEWAKVSAPVHSTMLIGGRWSVTAGQHVNGQLELHRESGDVSIAVDEQQLALQTAQLVASIEIRNDALSAHLSANAKGLGQLSAQAQTRLSQRNGKWGVSGRAPLSLSARADVGTLKPLVALYSKALVADGRFTLEVKADGTVSEPNLRGRADAQQISIEHVENGMFLRDGVLHATFDGAALSIAELSIAGGTGRFNSKGRIVAKQDHVEVQLDWTAMQLAAVQRPDLFLAVTGNGTFSYQRERVALNGQLRVDRGRIELRSETAPALSDDVVVVGRKTGPTKVKVLSAAIDLTLDLGPDFQVTGRGVDARLVGKLHLTSPGNAPISAQGEISVARGTSQAYGRKLEIERGTLYFTGPLDNPGLSIRAMRKNQQVEAGVEISGTARAPLVVLVSNPDVPDQEKLAWLVLGRKVDANNRSDAQALQSAAALLLADIGTSPLQTQIAKRFGLDEISLSSSEGTGTGSNTGGAVTIAKRISDRIYVMFEQNLGAAGNAIKINYQLSRRLSLRTESGRTNAVDLFYSFSWD